MKAQSIDFLSVQRVQKLRTKKFAKYFKLRLKNMEPKHRGKEKIPREICIEIVSKKISISCAEIQSLFFSPFFHSRRSLYNLIPFVREHRNFAFLFRKEKKSDNIRQTIKITILNQFEFIAGENLCLR